MERYIHLISDFINRNQLFSKDNNGRTKKLLAELDTLSPGLMMIFDYEKFQAVYLNTVARDFLGVPETASNTDFSFWLKLIHPVCVGTVQYNFMNLKKHPAAFNQSAVLVHSEPKDTFAWIYTSTKVISFTPENTPKLFCTVAVDIEEMVSSGNNFKNGHVNGTEKNNSIAITLTKREQVILEFICKEFTSKEIAGFLRISEATVEADRKKMLQKLGAKSMIGLVKYALKSNMVSL